MASKRASKPRATRTANVLMRVTVEEKRLLTEAADVDGLCLTTWLRTVGLHAARERKRKRKR